MRLPSGFTLMEIIIYTALLGLTASALIMLAVAVANNRDKVMSAEEVSANTQLLRQELNQLIHSARSVNVVDSVFDSDQGILAVFLDESQLEPVMLRLVDGRAQLEKNGVNQDITSQLVTVKTLRFTQSADRQISVEAEVDYGAPTAVLTPEKDYQQTFSATIGLRL